MVQQHQIINSLMQCAVYALCSMSFSFAAKFLFKVFAFHNTTILLLYENTINIIICTIVTLIRNQQAHSALKDKHYTLAMELKLILKDRWKQAIHTIPFTLTYGSGVYCGMKALSLINIPLFLALRRTLIFFVFLFEMMMGKTNALSMPFVVSIMFITIGAIVAGCNHFTDDIVGYTLVIVNNIFSALSLHIAKRLNTTRNLSPLELVYNNSLNLWPILLMISIFTNEINEIFEFEALYNTEFKISITMVAIIGLLLNLATSNCTMKNSPFAIAITHNVKDILSTGLSFILFTDIQVDMYLMIGIMMSFMGAFIYSYNKLSEVRKNMQIALELPVQAECNQLMKTQDSTILHQ